MIRVARTPTLARGIAVTCFVILIFLVNPKESAPTNFKMKFDIRRLDVYRKVSKDFTQPTTSGAIVSILCILFIVFLVCTELSSFIQLETVSEVFVDRPSPVSNGQSPLSSDQIIVKVNITLPHLNCEYLGLDIQDEMGRHEVGFMENTRKVPLNDNTGCLFDGSFHINKVPGNFHFSTHGAQEKPRVVNMQHMIHSLEFGDDQLSRFTFLPGSFDPLQEIDHTTDSAQLSHDYYMKLVPTIYRPVSGDKLSGYQYTYAYKGYGLQGGYQRMIPAIWFRYDLSPLTVQYTDRRKPVYHFITMICAIVGGTFTVAGIIDAIVFNASEVFRKLELGKQS
ncbi:endoplasmic reticulum-Golgi intermediate compartment protein 1-like [Dysidea avara]|uniref:endoplasmic reticulum-Golgi intermediate compartment protein 1-like n=1 Tax=Dysidea avara TaxID=196820 RepID=UPI0033298976